MGEWLRQSAVAQADEGPAAATSSGGWMKMRERAAKLDLCGCHLLFRHYPTIDQVRLHSGFFCQQDRLCPFCAIRRASKLMRRYLERVVLAMQAEPLIPCMVTFTVKNGPDLVERFDHLVNHHRQLMGRRKNAMRGQQWSESALAAGLVAAVEVKRGRNSDEWHPHMHAVWLCRGRLPDEAALRAEWLELTGDSHQVKVSPMHCAQKLHPTAEDMAADFCEVFKYSLKFSSMSPEDNWAAFLALEGRHMVQGYGCLFGVKVPESLLDDDADVADLPYVELLYRYLGGDGGGRFQLVECSKLQPGAPAVARVPRAEVSAFRAAVSRRLAEGEKPYDSSGGRRPGDPAGGESGRRATEPAGATTAAGLGDRPGGMAGISSSAMWSMDPAADMAAVLPGGRRPRRRRC